MEFLGRLSYNLWQRITIQTASVLSPPPSYNGKQCAGPPFMIKMCRKRRCQGKYVVANVRICKGCYHL